MGCDIHLYVEKKTADKRWVAIDGPNRWFGKYEDDKETRLDWLYYDRNYDLFAILADVRNGYGVAGIDTGDGFIPIAEPKGLPKDVSPDVKEISDDWDVDGHSHSWFTLSELLAYNWEQTTKHRGWVNVEGFKEYLRGGRPTSWYSGIGGGGVTHISPAMMQERIDNNGDTDGCYCQVEWEVAYYEATKDFCEETIPKLKELSEGDYNSIRIVFWFDN